MKTFKYYILSLFISTFVYGQAGHIMQGVGAVNMSMGGASTAQPLDISGALQWNPATMAAFNHRMIKLDIGLFYSSPLLSSTVPEFDNLGQPTGNFLSGNTHDSRGPSPMPALAMVWANNDSRHSFGVSAFGVSGFGVNFPENPLNPINAPQNMGGFGTIESNYLLLQIGLAYAFEITDELSVGIQHNLNYGNLKLMPNPTSEPTAVGYPSTTATDSWGFGEQMGVFYNGKSGLKLGISYKTKQLFRDYEFKNTFLDESTGSNSFDMDYPAIFSSGIGYSNDLFDLAADYRRVFYSSTNGFKDEGWNNNASVKGFGWDDISIFSTGIQFKGIQKVPLRIGYTYSTNPISSEVAFFNVPATAIIRNAFQIGMSYVANDRTRIDGVFHRGTSSGPTKGQLLNPMFIPNYPPYGAIPGSEVSYEMTTYMIMVGVNYLF